MSSVEVFLSGMSSFCKALMPVAGLVILIYLVLFVKELIVMLKSLTKTLDSANEAVKKLDGPLDTVDELCQTVDEVHAAAKEAAVNIASTVTSKMDALKGKIEHKSEPVEQPQNETAETVLENPLDAKEETVHE